MEDAEYAHECDCELTESDKVKECYRYDDGSGDIHHDITLSGGVSVIHAELLEEWRRSGYELFAFGRNRTDIDNLTAHFIKKSP